MATTEKNATVFIDGRCHAKLLWKAVDAFAVPVAAAVGTCEMIGTMDVVFRDLSSQLFVVPRHFSTEELVELVDRDFGIDLPARTVSQAFVE